ncbi:MAG: PASTA domain-containing protein [Oscillospiraceae bacterium]|nr:PASTA domain-containing protein [Oscillospiraceae bacterium]
MMSDKNIIRIVLIAVFCVICCMIPVCLYFNLSRPELFPNVAYTLVDPTQQVIVPEVLYLPSEEACAQLETLGLQVVFHEDSHHPVIPENQVLVQSPSAGSILHPGDPVFLTRSDGWKECVPDVRNLTQQAAYEILEKAGFSVTYQAQPSDSTAPDTVISQSIAPDSRAEIGSMIQLMISSGRENLDQTKLETVGDYVGMEFETAKVMLSELYLYAFQTDTVYNPDIPNHTIIAQDVSSGKQLPQGSVVRMTVSLGQEVAKVPDCVDLDANSARTLLEDAGFHCVIQYISDSSYGLDKILGQSAEAGTKLAVGSKIILTASVGTANQVISTGGWSGNPLPSFNTEPETETESDLDSDPESEILPEEFAPENPENYFYETAPDPIVEDSADPVEPEIPEIPEITEIPETAPDLNQNPEYQDAPETAPFWN